MSLDNYLSCLKNGEVLKRAVVLSFDDCYRNVLVNAIPILSRYKIPATIFVNSGLVGLQRLDWCSKVAYLVNQEQTDKLVKRMAEYVPDLQSSYVPDSLWDIYDLAMKMNTKVVGVLCDEILDSIGECELDLAQYANLYWNDDDFDSIDRSIISFGNHTSMHYILSTLTPSEQHQEILLGKEFLSKRLGITNPPFSVPNGRPEDFSEKCERIVQDTGHSSILYATGGTNNEMSDCFRLNRKLVPNVTSGELGYFFREV